MQQGKNIGSNRTIAKNTVILYVRSFVMMAIGIFTGRVVLQALGVSDFGLYGAIGSMVAMFQIMNGVLAVGTSRFLTYELGRNDNERVRECFNASFAMHCAMAFVLLLLFETVGLWLVNTKLNIPEGRYFAANVAYQLSILTCLMGMTQVPYGAVIIAREHFDVFAYVGLGEAIFKLVFPILLVYGNFGDNLIAYAVICDVWTIGLQIFYRIYCYKRFPETHLRLCRDKKVYKGMLSYSLWDLLGQFCATGISQGINLLINVFFGVNLNASRGVALTVEGKITTFNGNFLTATSPQITKNYASGNIDRFFQLIYEAGKCSAYLILLLSLPIFIEAEYILSLWLVEVPPMTVIFLRFLMVAVFLRSPMRPILTGIHATGDVKFLNLTSGLMAVILTLPGVYLIYRIGFAPWSYYLITIPVGAISTFLEVYSLKRKVSFSMSHYFANVHLKVVVVAVLSATGGMIPFLVWQQSLVRCFATLLFSMFSTVFFVWTIGISKSQRQKLISIVKTKMGIASR